MLSVEQSKVKWEVQTKPIEMKKAKVASGKPRRIGEVVEVNQTEFTYLVNSGAAIPSLGEPVVKKKTTRKKNDRD